MECKLYLLNCLVAAKRNIRGNESRLSSIKFGFVEREREREIERKNDKIIRLTIDDKGFN